jgi:hypothetical protein
MEKKCELCGSPKVYDIKSHFTPRSISESTYGEKDKEYIVTISPFEGTIDEFYGREHPDAEPNHIKPQPNVGKAIFCKGCEEALGKFESECQNQLNNAISALSTEEIKVFRTGRGVKYIKVPVPSNIMRMFYYSVVWRQCLEQLHVGADSSLNPVEFQKLRSILNTELHKSLNEIAKSDSFKNYPQILVFTTQQKGVDTGFNNPSGINSNPEVFFIARTICLYWKEGDITSNFGRITHIPSRFLRATALLNAGLSESCIALIKEEEFERMKAPMINKVTRDFIMTHIQKVAKHKGVSLVHAAKYLEMEAQSLRVDDSPQAYTESIIAASKKLQGL